MVLPFLALYLTTERGFTAARAGLLLSLYGVGAAAGTLGGGWLCDRIDPNKLQVASLFGAAAGLVALGFLRTEAALAVALVAVGAVAEAFRPANSTALAAACRPEQRLRAFALRRLALNLGMTFGPAIGGFLALRDYRLLFAVDGATCALATAPLFVLLRRPAAGAEGDDRTAAPAAGAPAAGGVAAGASSPWRDGPFLALMGLVTLLALVLFQVWGTYALTLRELYRLTEDRIGLLFAINTLIIVAVEMALVTALARRDPLRVAAAGALLLCLGLGLTALGASFAFAAFGVVVWTLGEMLAIPLTEGIVANRAGAGASGRYMGVFAATFSLAFVAAPALGTAVYGRFGPAAVWAGAAAAGPLIAAGYLALAPRFRAAAVGAGGAAPADGSRP
jgi:predicted MFS family arabinose efflux permease